MKRWHIDKLTLFLGGLGLGTLFAVVDKKPVLCAQPKAARVIKEREGTFWRAASRLRQRKEGR